MTGTLENRPTRIEEIMQLDVLKNYYNKLFVMRKLPPYLDLCAQNEGKEEKKKRRIIEITIYTMSRRERRRILSGQDPRRHGSECV